MLGVLPPEVILTILSFIPLRQLYRFLLVSKSWNTFILLNESSIYRAAAVLHGFIPANTKLHDADVSDVRITHVDSWKDLCIKFYRMERRWEGHGRARFSVVAAPGEAVWRFKVDGEQRTVITTHFNGGLQVSAINQDTILWSLPPVKVCAFAHCEYSDGFLVFTREGETLDIWRRTRDARTNSRPLTAEPDACQERANSVAWQSAQSASDNDRGAFIPWAAISPPTAVRALRLVHSTLLVASESAQAAYLYDVQSGRLKQTISFRNSHKPPVQVNYVELGSRHIFVCTMHNVLVCPMDANDSQTSLEFPGQIEGFHEFYETRAFLVDYGTNVPINSNTGGHSTLVECSVEQRLQRSVPSDQRNFRAGIPYLLSRQHSDTHRL
ncbi:hypothetical protein JB92DRAFT_2712245 [Gautieria morchelliformis]|nr:hypothetical protein JB92DRAFT_2712245 [Gautieria morchelliformis]